MKILIDIGHPSHVHYFKNFIKVMSEKGHKFFVTARDKEVVHKLLLAYGIEYKSRGKGGNGIIGKLLYTLKTDKELLSFAKSVKPDLLLSCSSPYLAHVSFIIRKPHICIDDTDIAKYEHLMYVPFSDCIISPKGFSKNFGSKHLFINSLFDLFYLHPKYFTPDLNIKRKLEIDGSRKSIFMRFTSMNANHDWGYNKISFSDKLNLINKLCQNHKVMLSSEDKLPEDLIKYKIHLEPEEIHSALAYSDLFIGESGSMSTEAAILGVPSINLTASALEVGVFKQLTEKGLLFIIPDAEQALQKATEILASEYFNLDMYKNVSKEFVSEKADITSFLVWFIEKYPKSKIKFLTDSRTQNNFIRKSI